MNYPLPGSTIKAWVKHKDKLPQNLGLVFDRFVQNWGEIQDRDKEAKWKAWEEIEKAAQKADKNLLKQLNTRWYAGVRSAGAETFTMKTDWRFVAGLGRRGPLEVGFTFHRYGFPILPGSSVKGIARAWGLLVVAENLNTNKLNELNEILSIDKEEKFNEKFAGLYSQASEEAAKLVKNFRVIFGTLGSTGQAVFFDAIPVELPRLELDVINPHYTEYYQDKEGKTPPANWFSPKPVYFLTVAKDTKFNFAVGWRGLLDGGKTHPLHAFAKEWLIEGLKNLGAGAKTSTGYGYFLNP